MNENYKNMNKFNLFKSYNNNIPEGDITSIIKIYDKKYVTSINNLSSLISNFINNTKAFIKALSEVCSTMKNQILYSQHLLLEINTKKEKFSQLCDRIEMIDNTRKLLDNHLLVINNNLNIFIPEAKKEFSDIKNIRLEKISAISKIKNHKNFNSMHNKSTSRGKIKKNFFEMENYFSNDKVIPMNNKENIYNNFIQCSEAQKNYSLLEKQNNYRKTNFNQSQEQFFQKKNDNLIKQNINKQKSASVLKGKYSRNKINVFQNSFSSRNNNDSSSIVKQKELPKKIKIKNNFSNEINSIELKLAYKVLEFIFIINNFQLQKNKNINNEIITKIEALKNNLMTLTKEVINQNQNKNKPNIKNKNIINNNFIYNNKENIEIKDNENSYNDESRDISMKVNELYEQIDKLKAKNQDLELLLKIKSKENKKLNKTINNKAMFQSYQGKNNIKINNNSSEKINNNNKHNNYVGNIKNKIEPKVKNNDLLLLNKKIEELNSTINILKKEKTIINSDLTGKINSLLKQNTTNKLEYEKLINNLNNDIKEKDNKINFLNNQINELNEQIEKKNSNNIININDNNIFKQNNKNINEYDYKMFMLKEKNKYFQDTLNSFDEQIKFNEQDIEQLKNNINTNISKKVRKKKVEFKIFYNNNFSLISEIKNKNENKENKFSPEKYEILCDKYFNNIHWFLLINKKDKEKSINDPQKMFWAERNKLINIDNFNKYISEAEEENKNIIKYISKLEEKEDTISKLNYKLSQIEKLNSLDDVNIIYNKTDKIENSISKDKYNNFVSKIIKLENEIKSLKKENDELKANIEKEKEEEENNERNNKSYETDEYKKFEEKIKKDETKKSDKNKNFISIKINNKKEIEKDDSMENNFSNSNEINEETDKITEQIDEENESAEKSSESIKNNLNNKMQKEKSKGSNNVQKQLERITKLYEELDKKLKQIKNEIKKIFTDVVIKEKEKEIKALFEICGFTEDEISEMLMYTESN